MERRIKETENKAKYMVQKVEKETKKKLENILERERPWQVALGIAILMNVVQLIM